MDPLTLIVVAVVAVVAVKAVGNSNAVQKQQQKTSTAPPADGGLFGELAGAVEGAFSFLTSDAQSRDTVSDVAQDVNGTGLGSAASTVGSSLESGAKSLGSSLSSWWDGPNDSSN